MMNEAPGPINFTMFLTLFGERLQGTDPEDVIKNAFGCFDEENQGVIHEERLRELLISMGDRFSDEDVSSPGVMFSSFYLFGFGTQCVTFSFYPRWMKCIGRHQSRMECLITSSSQGFWSMELRTRMNSNQNFLCVEKLLDNFHHVPFWQFILCEKNEGSNFL